MINGLHSREWDVDPEFGQNMCMKLYVWMPHKEERDHVTRAQFLCVRREERLAWTKAGLFIWPLGCKALKQFLKERNFYTVNRKKNWKKKQEKNPQKLLNVVCKSEIWFTDLLEEWHLLKSNFSGCQWRICYGTAAYLVCPQKIFFSEKEKTNREVGGI